jgi:hypothetical protein
MSLSRRGDQIVKKTSYPSGFWSPGGAQMANGGVLGSAAEKQKP